MGAMYLRTDEDASYEYIGVYNFNNDKNSSATLGLTTDKAESWEFKNNTSGYTGVTYHKGHKKWMAHIQHKGVSYFIGYFDLPEDGAHAFDKKLIEIDGNRAKLNFPEEYYL